jgi:hypothetical protein
VSKAEDVLTIRPGELVIPEDSALTRVPWIGLVVGALGLIASALLYGGNPQQFYYSWLVSFLFFISLALGGMFFVLLHFVTKSGWGIVVRRLAENAIATMPLFVLLFIPIALGIHELFHWSHADVVAGDPLLQGKAPYLNQGFFLVRAAVYLLLWTLIAVWYRGNSVKQDRTGEESISRRLSAASGPGIIVFALTISYAAIDWAMSLDPHWYSTIFGVYYFSGCLVGIFALMVLMAAALERSGVLRDVINVEHFHDLGKLLFAFTVFWAYIAFSQFFLIWYGNIPEETLWYLHRAEGGWKSLSVLLALGHFVVPFFFLMPRAIKRKRILLVLGALWMLTMHWIDIYWLIMPNLHQHEVHFSLLDLTTLLGIGGLFVAMLGWLMRRQAVVPVRDPRLVESIGLQGY